MAGTARLRLFGWNLWPQNLTAINPSACEANAGPSIRKRRRCARTKQRPAFRSVTNAARIPGCCRCLQLPDQVYFRPLTDSLLVILEQFLNLYIKLAQRLFICEPQQCRRSQLHRRPPARPGRIAAELFKHSCWRRGTKIQPCGCAALLSSPRTHHATRSCLDLRV
jgi:hypothetical protein